MYAQLLTFGAAFLGSAVESVEALTIVLAVGLTRGWRSPLYGAAVALVLLAVLVLVFGQLIVTRVPELTLKLIIGTLIVLFGLRWLHKAILRSAGVIAMHDENKSYEDTVKELSGSPLRQDWVAFTIALKGVFLEGHGGGLHRGGRRRHQRQRRSADRRRRRFARDGGDRHPRRGRPAAARAGA